MFQTTNQYLKCYNLGMYNPCFDAMHAVIVSAETLIPSSSGSGIHFLTQTSDWTCVVLFRIHLLIDKCLMIESLKSNWVNHNLSGLNPCLSYPQATNFPHGKKMATISASCLATGYAVPTVCFHRPWFLNPALTEKKHHMPMEFWSYIPSSISRWDFIIPMNPNGIYHIPMEFD